MSDEGLAGFRLLGHDCPTGRYPAPVVPIGRLGERLVAIYHPEDGHPEAVEIAEDARFVMHDAALASKLGPFSAFNDLLFAVSPTDVTSFSMRSESLNLLMFREASDDPFYRLALSSVTGRAEVIQQDLRACMQYILSAAPELAGKWYGNWRARLGSRKPALYLPLDFRSFLNPPSSIVLPGPSEYRRAERETTPAASAPLILLEGVQKVFTTDEVETHALSDIDLRIRRGEYLTVEGPSGCGKSTLLSILGMLDKPSSGEYYLNGSPVSSLPLRERARIRNREIGFIFQAFNLLADLTVYENVELPLTYRGMSYAERKRRVEEALERVGMSHRRKHYPSQLSGGQQQRVAVARALTGDPLILLADEPTGNLDSANGEVVMGLLHELHAAGNTICTVTHDPRYVRYANRVVRMFDGRIVDEAEIFSPV